MVGNKGDLDGQRDVTFEEAKQFADENGTCCLFACLRSVLYFVMFRSAYKLLI